VANLEPLLRLHPSDNLAVTRRAVKADEIVTVDGQSITIAEAIPANHKVAIQQIAKGQTIRKFGQPIGSAVTPISVGQWIHVQNVSIEREQAGYEFCTEIVPPPKPAEPRTFMGYRRKDGNQELYRRDQHRELFGDDGKIRGSGTCQV
jgi:altronate hydrolase